MTKLDAIIYCDGACSGNPGPGGWGTVVALDHQVRELGGAEGSTTNNRMEITAAYEGLLFVLEESARQQKKLQHIEVFTDSVYVIRGVTQWMPQWKKRGWKTAEQNAVSNQDLWKLMDNVLFLIKEKHSMVKLSWSFVKGHSGVLGNEKCDEIAVSFSQGRYYALYDGSVENYEFDILKKPNVLPLPEMKSKNSETKKTVWYISLVNGVFSQHKTWGECEALVKGRAAKYKKVSSLEEEIEVKKSWGIS